jgi:MFS family permease
MMIQRIQRTVSESPGNCKGKVLTTNIGSTKRKWAATLIVSCFTLVSPISSSMIAPALTSISAEFGITNEVEAQLTLSIFVLAYAIGPLFLGPLSEIYGRVIVLQLSNLFYLAWNLGCGFAQTSGQLMAFRFFSGLGGSAPLAIGGVRYLFAACPKI